MFPEIERFSKWLRCRSPQATTHLHYTSDVKLFFAWAKKVPAAITLHDVDAYVAHCRGIGHAAATVNRRLAALRTPAHSQTCRKAATVVCFWAWKEVRLYLFSSAWGDLSLDEE